MSASIRWQIFLRSDSFNGWYYYRICLEGDK